MWECPDYINIDGKDVLIFSPQGVNPKGFDYNNIYNVVYAIGNMNLDNLVFEIDTIKEFEKGFDFYAPQTFKKGKKINLHGPEWEKFHILQMKISGHIA